MSMTDPIADYLAQLRNASGAKKKYVDIPASRVKAQMSKILLDAGYISGVKYIEDERQGLLRVYPKYDRDNVGVLNGTRRVSKCSRRVYSPKKGLPRVLGGYGIAIISTSQGILTDIECRKRGIGGEVMCEIW